MKKIKFTVGYHHGKLNVLPYNYYFPPMTCSPLIVNCLPGSLYNNVPLLWNFSSKKVTHINNGVRMWNIMKGFMYEVNRLAIDKVCCKSKIKDWGYMSSINVWGNMQNGHKINWYPGGIFSPLYNFFNTTIIEAST